MIIWLFIVSVLLFPLLNLIRFKIHLQIVFKFLNFLVNIISYYLVNIELFTNY